MHRKQLPDVFGAEFKRVGRLFVLEITRPIRNDELIFPIRQIARQIKFHRQNRLIRMKRKI